jgi:CheY-like chemotaxis protein
MKSRGNVLVVDADHRLQKRIREIVEPHGFDAAWARTVRETFAHMHLFGAPRLLLVTLDYSNLVGWSVLEAIQKNPTMNLPSIALATPHPRIAAAHRIACVGYPILSIPIVDDDLLDLIDPAVGPPRRISAGKELSTSGVALAPALLRRASHG